MTEWDYTKYIYTYGTCDSDDYETNLCSGDYCESKSWCAFDCCLDLAFDIQMCSDGPGYTGVFSANACDGGSGGGSGYDPTPSYYDGGDSESESATIGIIFFILLLVAGAALAIFLIIRHKRKKAANTVYSPDTIPAENEASFTMPNAAES